MSDTRPRDPYAASLRDGSLQPRRVQPRHGRGSYTRKGRRDRDGEDA